MSRMLSFKVGLGAAGGEKRRSGALGLRLSAFLLAADQVTASEKGRIDNPVTLPFRLGPTCYIPADTWSLLAGCSQWVSCPPPSIAGSDVCALQGLATKGKSLGPLELSNGGPQLCGSAGALCLTTRPCSSNLQLDAPVLRVFSQQTASSGIQNHLCMCVCVL